MNNQITELAALISDYQDQYPNPLTQEELDLLGVENGLIKDGSIFARIKFEAFIDGYATALFPGASAEEIIQTVNYIYSYVQTVKKAPLN